MKYFRHRADGAGFMATSEPSDQLPLHQAGEVWAQQKWSIAWHTNPGWEIYFQAKGKSLWEIGGEQVEIPENGAYLIREGTRHRLRSFSPNGAHFYWTVFSPETVPTEINKARCWRRSHTIVSQAHALLHPLQGIIREVSIKESWQRAACEWSVALLCATFTRLTEIRHPGQTPIRHPGAERAHRLLVSRLEHPWRLDELARLSGVSLQHLIEIFRQEYGQTPIRALLQMRLEEARRRLQETELSVTEIAFQLGFASSQHFARNCRKAFGKTPTQLRRKMRGSKPPMKGKTVLPS